MRGFFFVWMQLDVNYNKTVQKVQTPPVLKACILKCIGLIIYSHEQKAMLDAVLLLPGRGPFHEREAKDECPTEVAYQCAYAGKHTRSF